MVSNVLLSLLGALAFSASSVSAGRQLEGQGAPEYTCQEYRVARQGKAGIQRKIDAFLHAVGGVDNGNEVGDQGSGHRSINWDAGVVPFVLPPHFFNFEVPRGLQYSSQQDLMVVSNPEQVSPLSQFGEGDVRLSFFEADNRRKFRAFSGDRIFCPFDAPQFEASFFESGSSSQAGTTAFGLVALDVDKHDDAYMTFHGKGGEVLHRLDFLPQPGQDRGFSFAGLVCDKPVIHNVEVHLGSSLFDVCVDDVFFGEPTKTDY